MSAATSVWEMASAVAPVSNAAASAGDSTAGIGITWSAATTPFSA
ncbi:hypothetical protein ABTY96_07835 [Streptomyces sp. NPDC096057]